jgi:hypothetical protein
MHENLDEKFPEESTFCGTMGGYGGIVARILAASTVLRAIYTANTGTRMM